MRYGLRSFSDGACFALLIQRIKTTKLITRWWWHRIPNDASADNFLEVKRSCLQYIPDDVGVDNTIRLIVLGE